MNVSHFSSTNCSEVMSKRTQKDAGEKRVTAKSMDDELGLAMQTCLPLLHQKARGKPDMKVKYL